MPIYKCFFRIVNRNKSSIYVNLLVFAVLMTIMFTMRGSEFTPSYSETAVNMAVINRDSNELSIALTDYLSERHNVKDVPDDAEKLQDALFYRDVEYILTIPEGFGESFAGDGNVTLSNVKLPGSATGIYLDNQIDRYLATVRAYVKAGFNLSDALSETAKDLQLGTTVEKYGDMAEGIPANFYYFDYFAYIIIAMILGTLGPALIALHQTDLRRRADSSSLTLKSRNLQTAVGSIITSLVLWLLFILAAVVSFHDEVFTIVFALQVLNSLAFLIVCVSIAFLTGQLLSNAKALGAVTNAVALGMSFICGIFVSQDLLGESVLAVARFLPAYWYVRSNDMLAFSSTVDMAIYAQGLLFQIGFAVAIFAVSLVVSRQKRNHPAAA